MRNTWLIVLAATACFAAAPVIGWYIPASSTHHLLPTIIGSLPIYLQPFLIAAILFCFLSISITVLAVPKTVVFSLVLAWLGFSMFDGTEKGSLHWEPLILVLTLTIVVRLARITWWSHFLVTTVLLSAAIAFLDKHIGEQEVVVILIGAMIYDVIAVYKTSFMDKAADGMTKLQLPNMLLLPAVIETDEAGNKHVVDPGIGLGGGDVVLPGLVFMLATHGWNSESLGTWIPPFMVVVGFWLGYLLLEPISERFQRSHAATVTLFPCVLLGYYLGRWFMYLCSST